MNYKKDYYKYLGKNVRQDSYLDSYYIHTLRDFKDFLTENGFDKRTNYLGFKKNEGEVYNVFSSKNLSGRVRIEVSPFEFKVYPTGSTGKEILDLSKVWQRFLIKRYNKYYSDKLNSFYLRVKENVINKYNERINYFESMKDEENYDEIDGLIIRLAMQKSEKVKNIDGARVDMQRYFRTVGSGLITSRIKQNEAKKNDTSKSIMFGNNFDVHIQEAPVNIRRDETGEFGCKNCK